ncbi:MAG: hypothetical protein WKG01_34580 [Kofleriaceae bacterium]
MSIVSSGSTPGRPWSGAAASRRRLAQVVAVQVDAHRVDARADQAWSDLAFEPRHVELAILRIDRVVAVGVEQRHDHEHQAGEQIAVAIVEQVAHQHQAGFLALDLARVDAVDHEHDRQPAGPRVLRRLHTVRRHHDQRQLAPAGTGAEQREREPGIVARVQGGEERHHIGVETGLFVFRGLGARLRLHGADTNAQPSAARPRRPRS